jgi:hypothetical protein
MTVGGLIPDSAQHEWEQAGFKMLKHQMRSRNAEGQSTLAVFGCGDQTNLEKMHTLHS